MGNSKGLKGSLVLGTALATAIIGYGRRAYAVCSNVNGTVTCSDTINSTVSYTNFSNTLSILFSSNATVDTSLPGGSGDPGVYASNTTGNLTISAENNYNNITGETHGIEAVHSGPGSLSITTTGNIVGNTEDGINANNIDGDDLTISSAAITGYSIGLNAINSGAGALSITTGNVIGTNDFGISARNIGTYLTIQSAAVTGGTSGIYAINEGSGALSITATGNITGQSQVGIQAYNSIDGQELLIEATAAVSGGTDGINAINYGSGALSITTSSLTQGGIVAIDANSSQSNTYITNNYSGILQNTSGNSNSLVIRTSGMPTDILNEGIITGTLELGNSGNNFTNSSIWNTAGGTNDFGTGANTLINNTRGIIYAANSGASSAVTTSLNAAVSNAGKITLQNEVVGDRLEITGDFIGQNGSLFLDTLLGADNSPSDQLVLNAGQGSGSTKLIINNVGGTGAQTSGDGIQVISATGGATITSTAFTLANYVATGAYQYALYEGGNSLTGGDPNNQNWYLRSSYRTAVPVYQSLPLIAQQFGLKMLDTLDDRVGTKTAGPPDTSSSGVWGRVIGQLGNGKQEGNDDLLTQGPGYDWSMGGFQLGMDILHVTDEGMYGVTTDIVGLDMGLANTAATVQQALNNQTAGTANIYGLSFGAYWTHYAENGWYTDTVLQGTYYNQLNLKASNSQNTLTGQGVLGSFETGMQFGLDEGWTLTPEAQFIYQQVGIGTIKDEYSAIRQNNVGEFYGRGGVRLAKSWTPADFIGQPLMAWTRINFWGSSDNESETTFATLSGANPVTFNSQLGSSWVQVSLGGTTPLPYHTGAFASLDASVPVSGVMGCVYSGRVGIKYIA